MASGTQNRPKGTSAEQGKICLMLWDKHELRGTVGDRFRRVVAQCGNSPAVKWAGRVYSYHELDRLSDSLARRVVEHLGLEAEPVALLLEPGVEVVVAILGLLKAGKIYAALDPLASPLYHCTQVQLLKARLVITSPELPCSLDMAQLQLRLEHDESTFAGPPITGSVIASVVFTSGSTAEPKAVKRSHRALLHRAYLYWREQQVGGGDRQALLAGTHFVASETDLFGALLNGATLCPYPEARPSITQLRYWLLSEQITLLHPAVGFFRHFAQSLDKGTNFPDLRLLALGGEPIVASDLDLCWKRMGPQCAVTHRYSSSEAGNVAGITWRYPAGVVADPMPAGYPCEDKNVRIEGPDGESLGCGEVGEIVVESTYLSDGYWGEESLSGPCRTGDLGYLDDKGTLFHLGRRDRLCKIRGHRVDLGAVEAALLSLPEVQEAALVMEEGEHLSAYLVAHPGCDAIKLKQRLAALLPSGSVPNRVQMVAALPLNANGKIDRPRLALPRDNLQTSNQMCDLWARHLRAEVGLDDDFFELGGTSIQAAQILVELEHQLDRPLEVSLFAQAPTVRRMSLVLENDKQPGLLIPIQTEGARPPLFCVHPNSGQVFPFLRLSRRLGAQQPVYALRARGLREGEQVHQDIRSMAIDYLAEVRLLQPEGPYHLGGRCMGGLVAFEMAHLLVEQGQEVKLLFMIDSPPPQHTMSSFRTLTWRTDHLLRWLNRNLTRPGYLVGRLYHRLFRGPRRRDISGETEQTRAARVNEHLERLSCFYRTSSLKVDMLYYHSELELIFGPLQQWESFCGGTFTGVPVPGEHGSLLREPGVRYLAAHLRATLGTRV